MAAARKQRYRDEDDNARVKAGYFTKMTDDERTVFDAKRRSQDRFRQNDDQNWPQKLASLKIKYGYSKMNDMQKKAFMAKVDDMRQKYVSGRDRNMSNNDNERI